MGVASLISLDRRIVYVALLSVFAGACDTVPKVVPPAEQTDPNTVDPNAAGDANQSGSTAGDGTGGTPSGGAAAISGGPSSPAAGASGTTPVAGTSGSMTGDAASGANGSAGTSALPGTAGNGAAASGAAAAGAAASGAAAAGGTMMAGQSSEPMCAAGTKLCNMECIPEASCCTAMDCATGASCESGMCKCPTGQHLCDTQCLSDTSPMSCGMACMPCPLPSGGTAECVSGECKPSCPSGTKICAGACIAEGRSCDGTCPTGMHDCSGNCVDSKSPMTCGTMCTACRTPAGGTATCSNGSCGIQCGGSTPKACTDHCAAECCGDNDCSGNERCTNGSCQCVPSCGTKQCGDNGCQGSCGTCVRLGANYDCASSGQCVCEKSCDNVSCGPNTDGCGGTCGCSGSNQCVNNTCQDKRTKLQSCEPTASASNPFGDPGNCASGLLCVGIGGTGSFCYKQTPCGSGEFAAFNTVCLQTCDISAPSCALGTHCILNGELGGASNDGYCIAPNQ